MGLGANGSRLQPLDRRARSTNGRILSLASVRSRMNGRNRMRWEFVNLRGARSAGERCNSVRSSSKSGAPQPRRVPQADPESGPSVPDCSGREGLPAGSAELQAERGGRVRSRRGRTTEGEKRRESRARDLGAETEREDAPGGTRGGLRL